jgi:hypothetical protein
MSIYDQDSDGQDGPESNILSVGVNASHGHGVGGGKDNETVLIFTWFDLTGGAKQK